MLKIGIVGLGHIGQVHLEAAQHVPSAKVTAIATSKCLDREAVLMSKLQSSNVAS